ncbi:T9SS type A sorting domain-containing protein [Maribellus comscasis]|uniref:T9SS type A sorting domain-containing protein n=1 Tax=Maribellus comscasis TaxID=2681766 RepID=UPI00131E39B2|nr:T9SS type A sorting domain-containing protein [Maribellus comscasis]
MEIVPSVLLDSVKINERLTEDTDSGIPNRFGVVQKVQINISEEGIKSNNNGVNIWRYELRCPDAVSLGVFFKTYKLPDGAAVYIYSPDRKRLRGGFTNQNNNSGTQLMLADFPGNELVIEYNEPDDAVFQGELVVGYVSRAYKELSSAANEWIQINCAEGEDWQTEKHAVCLMSFVEFPYTYYCSGALVNNARQDETPYFLTANHCISSNSVASTLVTYFNYENSGCESNDASLEQSLSGAELHATNSYSDFTLLELSEHPPEEYQTYFAGWNASDDEPSEGTSIHHPEGSYKCIALEYDAPESYRYLIQWEDNSRSMPNTHWEVFYDAGTDESGSSGCPLFDENKRIIGQLHGGDETSSLFGKFSVSWDYSSESEEQLKTWLDPDDTGLLRLDGVDYRSAPSADFSADVSVACLNTTVYFTDETTFSPSIWSWEFSPSTVAFVNGTDKNSQNPEVVFAEEGVYSVTLIAGNTNGYDTLVSENLIEAVANLNVSFIDFSDEVRLCGSEIQNYVFHATGANEFLFEAEEEYFDIEAGADSLVLSLKDAAKEYGSFDTYIKVTGSHGACTTSDSVLLHVIQQANDNIGNAIALHLGRNAYFSNECATAEDNEPYPPASGCLVENSWCPASGSGVVDNSIWFTFQGPASGRITIRTEGFDTQIALYEADSYSDVLNDNYTILAAADNTSSGNEAVIEDLKVTPFQTYWLQVDGYNGDYGELTINLISNSIEIYPNPSTGVFNITLANEKEGNVQLDVFSVNGKRIYSGTREVTYDSNTVSLDLTGKPAGIYFFRMTENSTVITRKIVLVH